jgi:phosphoserine phosphatase
MTEKLSLWNGTPVRKTIMDFVTDVTDEDGPNYVPPAERIATFDNDGTLWCEKPTYFQLLFAIKRLKEMAEADLGLLEQAAYKAAASGDMGYFASLYPGNVAELMQLVFDTHAGMPQAEFEALAVGFLSNAKHPRFGVPFKQMTYKPMIELIRYLEAHEFKVFIASAGGMSFVRTVAEEIYGIPRERVIGSNVSFETRMTKDGPTLHRKRGLVEPMDDGPGKPVNIELHIGRKPILACGNADGDIHMLWYTETARYKSLQLVLHHDDAEREYAYEGASAAEVFALARERGWSIISMARDWKVVF